MSAVKNDCADVFYSEAGCCRIQCAVAAFCKDWWDTQTDCRRASCILEQQLAK